MSAVLRNLCFVLQLQGGEEDAYNALQFGRGFLKPCCTMPEDEAFLSEV